MINSYLREHLKNLQKQYQDILNKAVLDINKADLPMIIDEINLFWFSNRKLVDLILNNLSCDFDCYTFTGADFLDVDDFEHFPFIMLGKLHIVDDPLSKYSQICGAVENEKFTESLKERILLTIQDNLKILKNYSDSIYILPVTLLTEINSDLVKKAAEQAFYSMFKDNSLDLKKFSKFKSIEDVNGALKDGIGPTIPFSENENVNEDLCVRFRRFTEQGHPFTENLSEAMIFFFMVIGFFSQAFNILFRCFEYKMIPYLRFEVTFNYTITLGMNLVDNEEIKLTIFKSVCAHLLYRHFDKNKICDMDFSRFLSLIENFDHDLFDTLHIACIKPNECSYKEISKIINSKLKDLFQTGH